VHDGATNGDRGGAGIDDEEAEPPMPIVAVRAGRPDDRNRIERSKTIRCRRARV
jgi:hypothetical protein